MNQQSDIGAGQLIPRNSIIRICQLRDRSLQLFEEAYQLRKIANDKMSEANGFRKQASCGIGHAYYSEHRDSDLADMFKMPDRDKFLKQARHVLDADIWAYILKATELERLMDKKAKDELRSELMADPVEITEGNIAATLERFRAEAGLIFRRGIAEVFSKLDRRFKSHDGFKFGRRIIITNAFDEWGYWRIHRYHRDTIQDIERTFMVLEGLGVPDQWHGLIGAIDKAREGGRDARQSTIHSEYFKIQIYKNGNCHIWFKRDDLVKKVNRLIGEYYGEVVPDGRNEDDGDLHIPSMVPAKNLGFFPTPEDVAKRVIDVASLYRRKDDEPYTILEPSAGTGNLAKLACGEGRKVHCIELDPSRAAVLERQGLYDQVDNINFLLENPGRRIKYDRIVMNPPFDRELDIDHVMHALKFLEHDGVLVSVMSAGTEFRETKKSIAFREHIKSLGGAFRDLPERSFSEVGTNINTCMLIIGRTGWF